MKKWRSREESFREYLTLHLSLRLAAKTVGGCVGCALQKGSREKKSQEREKKERKLWRKPSNTLLLFLKTLELCTLSDLSKQWRAMATSGSCDVLDFLALPFGGCRGSVMGFRLSRLFRRHPVAWLSGDDGGGGSFGLVPTKHVSLRAETVKIEERLKIWAKQTWFGRISNLRIATMVKHAEIEASHGHEKLDEQPQSNGENLRPLKDFLAKFDANNRLGEHDKTKHPTLSSHALAPGIRHVRVVLLQQINWFTTFYFF